MEPNYRERCSKGKTAHVIRAAAAQNAGLSRNLSAASGSRGRQEIANGDFSPRDAASPQ
jgi:hypothetical protein